MNELSKRIITALILVVVVWAWYFHASQFWFTCGLALLGFVTTCELVILMKLHHPAGYILSSLALWIAFFYQPQMGQLLLIVFAWFFLFVLSSRSHASSFANFTGAIWMFSWLFAFAFVIADTHVSEAGQGLIIGVCLAVWASDVAAYFVGRKWGRNKLCPAISPGKSVEGLLGGVIAGVPVATFCWVFWDILPLLPASLLALLIVIAGVLGDLSESSLKRMVGAKDSGRLLPGHGGVLDRMDAIIMAVPVAWVGWSML